MQKEKRYRSVLKMSHDEVASFFLKQKSYRNMDLPEYFSFKKIRNDTKEHLNREPLRDYRYE